MDYATLKLIWWLLVGVLLIGFAVTDGFDMGATALLPFLGKTDDERRIIVNTVGATWEGNQVWLITAGGAMFAAWPLVYAASFSGFYFAMLLVLFALFFRPVGFDYRSKRPDPRWRAGWDWGLFIGGFVPALVFGVAFGNLLQGVPFRFDTDLRVSYHGSFWALLNPFALLCGLVSLTMLVAHGAAFIKMKTDGVIARRASVALRVSSFVAVVLFALAGVLVAAHVDGFHITRAAPADTVANPLLKEVASGTGLWLANYRDYPWMIAAPVVGIAAGLLATLLA
ncbi:cytochrome d ubiquinol oxidase subunit II, partial [Burkholderia multivorans]